jgi:filamentous hemagglutinin
MTPEMAAVVSLAVAYATGGAGGSILNAGLSSLASQAAVSFVNNGGDLSKVLNDLGSSQSVRGLVTSMVTAGVLQGLPNYLPTELQGVMNATAKSGFTDLLAKNLINNAASAVVNSAINGTSLEESLKTSIVSAIITTGMAKTANTIGDAASGKIEGVKLDEFGKSVAHAVAGCVAGTAKAGSGDGCTAGAVGAVVGELAAGFYNGDTGDGTGQPKADTVQFAALISGVAGALVGGDAQSVNIAASTGANAAANNYLNHNKPSLMRLSEKEQYERAVAECTGGNSQACDLKTNLAALSTKRDAELKDACSGSTPDLCNAKAKEAYAMGNIVSGSNGGFVFANSPESGVIRGLNTATIAPVTRPNSFNDSVSKSTSEAVLGLTCTSSVICRTALEGVGVGYVLSVAQNKPYTKADVVGDVVGGIVGLGFGNVLFGGVYKSTTALGGAAQFWIKQGADYSSGQAVSGALQSNVPASNNIAIPNISPIVIPNPWDYLKGQK